MVQSNLSSKYKHNILKKINCLTSLFPQIFGQGDAKQCREHVQKLNIENGVEAERLNQEYHKKKDLICVEPKEERWHGLDEHADAGMYEHLLFCIRILVTLI